MESLVSLLYLGKKPNKFETSVSLVASNKDILMILEKISESFPLSQFVLDGPSMTYHLDRYAQGGEILLISEIILLCNY